MPRRAEVAKHWNRRGLHAFGQGPDCRDAYGSGGMLDPTRPGSRGNSTATTPSPGSPSSRRRRPRSPHGRVRAHRSRAWRRRRSATSDAHLRGTGRQIHRPAPSTGTCPQQLPALWHRGAVGDLGGIDPLGHPVPGGPLPAGGHLAPDDQRQWHAPPASPTTTSTSSSSYSRPGYALLGVPTAAPRPTTRSPSPGYTFSDWYQQLPRPAAAASWKRYHRLEPVGRAQHFLMIGPWSHRGPVRAGPAGRDRARHRGRHRTAGRACGALLRPLPDRVAGPATRPIRW